MSNKLSLVATIQALGCNEWPQGRSMAQHTADSAPSQRIYELGFLTGILDIQDGAQLEIADTDINGLG